MNFWKHFAFLIVLIALAGCNTPDSNTSTTNTSNTSTPTTNTPVTNGTTKISPTVSTQDFLVTLKAMDKFSQETTTFVQGEVITIVLTITNTSSVIQQLTFGSSQQFDFAVKDSAGTTLWNRSYGMAALSVITSYSLNPGETNTITYQWNQIMNDGNPIPIGSYVLEANSFGVNIVPTQNLNII